MSIGPFFAPTHTMEPISIINHIGESPAVPSLNKLIWSSSHCQDSLIGEMKSFKEPTITSAVNTAAVNDQRIHKKQQNLNKNKLKKSSQTTNNIVPTSTDILSISEKFKKNNENRESSDKKRSKKRISNNTPENSQTMESLDEEGDIGAVFESSESTYGLISEYDSDLSKLRERFNYASIDCGANVLKANKEAKGTSAILSESKDSYVLNKCSAEKHIIVELCYPILIDTIVLANFEFFSSTFKNVKVSISKWYPPKEDWKVIGEYVARNSRELQIFNVKAPIMFAKYIRIDFQTHYGNHYYCPVSLLRVHGNSETDMWNKEQEQGELDSSTSHEEGQISDEPNDDILQEPSTESTEKDLSLLKEIEYLGNLKVEDKLQPKQAHVEQCNINNPDKISLVKTKNIFEYEVCPRDDSLDFKMFQGNSLIIHPGVCYIDQCPIIVTELDLLSDNYNDIVVPYEELPKKDNDMKEKPSQVQPKQNNNGKINLPVGGPNQSTYMLLFKRIHTLEVNTKREQNKLLKEVGKIDTHSKKMNSIMDDLTGTVENLKKQYEQLFQTTFSEFRANQSKLEEDLKSLASSAHLLVAEVVFLKRLLLFATLLFFIFVGVTHDWVNVRISLQDFHAAMNARTLALKRKAIPTSERQENTDYFYDDNVNDIYSE